MFLLSSVVIAMPSDSLIIAEETSIQVDSIIIRGNDTTEDFIILRELTFKKGDIVDGKQLNYNKERVYSLGIFNFVKVYVETPNQTTNVVFDVEESWYIYPVPFVNIRDKNLKTATYGLSVLFKNFRGRNETLQGIAAFGYDKFFLLSYFNPVFISDPEIEFQLTGLYQTPLNKSVRAALIHGKDFDFRVASGFVSFGKRLNQFNIVYANFGYNYVEAPSKNYKGIMASSSNIDRSISLGISYIYDSRDLKQFPENGVFAKIDYTNKGIDNGEIDYNVFNIDFREYRQVFNKFTTKWRIVYRHTFGRFVPLYDYSFLGYEEYVRGHRNDERDGNNMMLSSLELSIPFIRELEVSLDLPLLPKRLTSARLGLQANLFVDSGITYDNGQHLNFNSFDSGWGFGVTILVLPYNAIRFEYAFDEYRNGEFLIGSGFSF